MAQQNYGFFISTMFIALIRYPGQNRRQAKAVDVNIDADRRVALILTQLSGRSELSITRTLNPCRALKDSIPYNPDAVCGGGDRIRISRTPRLKATLKCNLVRLEQVCRGQDQFYNFLTLFLLSCCVWVECRLRESLEK